MTSCADLHLTLLNTYRRENYWTKAAGDNEAQISYLINISCKS